MKPATPPRVLFVDLEPDTGLAADVEECLGATCSLVREEMVSPPAETSTSDPVFGESPRLRDRGIAGAIVCVGTIDSASEARIEATLAKQCGLPALLVTENWDAAILRRLLWSGACDFATRPFGKPDFSMRVMRLVSPPPERRAGRSARPVAGHPALKGLIGVSEAFLRLVRRTVLAAGGDSTIFIQGETGTGKSLLARAIHEFSGHEREAFTGAARTSHGVVRQADGGTLFLDEVNSLPLPAQAKLLGLLEDGEYRPLGSGKTLKADVRFIAAANRDPLEAVRSGSFRADLYHRLSGFPLEVPPLRQRVRDILPLSLHFLEKSAIKLGRATPALSSDAAAKLLVYSWPGNVRELQQTLEKGVVLAETRMVVTETELELGDARCPFDGSLGEAKERAERDYLEGLLVAHAGNVTRAARSANTHRRTLRRLIEKHGIEVRRFRVSAP